MRRNPWLIVCGAGVALAAAPAGAQSKRPDTLQTLGVGARSIGLGGAYVGLAEDLTAVFWNPAGLAQLQSAQFEVDGRTLVKTDRNPLGIADINATSMQFSFAGLSYPLRTRGSNTRGTIAISRTLGGFEQIMDPAAGPAPTLARYWFTSLGYGRQVSDKLRVGIAAHYVELKASANSPGPALIDRAKGDGATFSVGGQYLLSPNTTLGLTYFNPTRVGGVDPTVGNIFGTKINGRVAVGLAHRFGKQGPGSLLASVEGRTYFGGDDSSRVLERRGSTSDAHVGLEYAIPQGQQVYYLRGGFYTRNASDPTLFYDDRVATFGAGFERVNRLRLDVGVEMSTVRGTPLVTTSLRYMFGKGSGSKSASPSSGTGSTSNPAGSPGK